MYSYGERSEIKMSVSSFVFVIFFILFVSSHALPAKENTVSDARNCLEIRNLNLTAECFAMKMLTKLQEISQQQNIDITTGVVLSSDNPINQRTAKQIQVIQISPSTEEKMTKILDLMLEVMNSIFAGRTLKIRLPNDPANTVKRALEEGRGKMKKFMNPLLLAIGAKMLVVIPIMIGGLFLLASKALIVSKVALALTLIIAVQYLFMGGGNILGKFGQGGGNNIGGYGGQNAHSYGGYGAPGWNVASPQSFPYAR